MSSSKRSRFTLIELVVAIALLIAVTTIVAMSSATFYNAYQRSLTVTARLKEMMAIDQIMDTHIRNMIPFKWKDDEGTSRLLFNGDENELFFTTLRRSYGDKPGALLFIRIYVEEGNLIAAYSPYPRLPWLLEEEDDSMPWTKEILAENVEQVVFTYAENSTESENEIEFMDTYLEEENSSLPLAVKMVVIWENGKTEQWLRRVAGSSANSSFGVRTSSNITTKDNTTTTTVDAASANQSGTQNSSGRRRPGRRANRNSNSGGGAI